MISHKTKVNPAIEIHFITALKRKVYVRPLNSTCGYRHIFTTKTIRNNLAIKRPEERKEQTHSYFQRVIFRVLGALRAQGESPPPICFLGQDSYRLDVMPPRIVRSYASKLRINGCWSQFPKKNSPRRALVPGRCCVLQSNPEARGAACDLVRLPFPLLPAQCSFHFQRRCVFFTTCGVLKLPTISQECILFLVSSEGGSPGFPKRY